MASDDFPEPEGPTRVTQRSRAERRATSSLSTLRPWKTAASASWKEVRLRNGEGGSMTARNPGQAAVRPSVGIR